MKFEENLPPNVVDPASIPHNHTMFFIKLAKPKLQGELMPGNAH